MLDVAGAERYGHVQEGTDFNAAMGAGTLEVELLDGDLFGSRRRTGETSSSKLRNGWSEIASC